MFILENTLQTRIILLFIFSLLVAERLNNTFYNPKEIKPGKFFQKYFFFVLLVSYLFIVLIALGTFLYSAELSVGISLMGLTILLCGISLRRMAIHDMGPYWRVHIEIKPTQQIVKTGVYKYIKHPYYLAVLLELSGFSLVCNSILAVSLTVFVQIPLIAIRIAIENRVLKVYGKRKGFMT